MGVLDDELNEVSRRTKLFHEMIMKLKRGELPSDPVECHKYLKENNYFISKEEELLSLQKAEQCQSMDIEYRSKNGLCSDGSQT